MQTTNKLSVSGLSPLVRAYLTTALWCSVDSYYNRRVGRDEDACLDHDFAPEHFSQAALARAVADCERFERENEEALSAAIATGEVRCGPDFNEWERVGHDFWLTRNGHGAGFWDGDWPEPYGRHLSEAACKFGGVDLCVSDAGEVEMG